MLDVLNSAGAVIASDVSPAAARRMLDHDLSLHTRPAVAALLAPHVRKPRTPSVGDVHWSEHELAWQDDMPV